MARLADQHPARGRKRARAEGLGVRFQVADAEALPFADGSFDVVVSTQGCMFTADHARTAGEMLRVTRAGASAWPTGRRRASSAGCSR